MALDCSLVNDNAGRAPAHFADEARLLAAIQKQADGFVRAIGRNDGDHADTRLQEESERAHGTSSRSTPATR